MLPFHKKWYELKKTLYKIEKDEYCKELKRIYDGIKREGEAELSNYLVLIRDLYVHCSSTPVIKGNTYYQEFNCTSDKEKEFANKLFK